MIRPQQEQRRRPTRITANLQVTDLDAAKSFYTDFLGLSTEEFNLGWVARYTSLDSGANVQLVTSAGESRGVVGFVVQRRGCVK